MNYSTQCFLRSMQDTNINILLQDGVEVVLGRSPETNITDGRCSRAQVALSANYSSETVTAKHLGDNPSAANGIILRKDSSTLEHGHIIEFLVGKHQFQIDFVKESVRNDKRKRDLSSDNGIAETKRPCKKAHDVVASEEKTWEKIENGALYIFTSVGVKSSEKIAAYDLDGTIILTKSGRVFPKDKDDWTLANSRVKVSLLKFHRDGYKIVILTNQAGIGRGKTNITDFKYKVEKIVAELSVPAQVFIATSTSIYRKPAPGMWTYLANKKNDGIEIDMSSSFYIGDAAGRIANWAPGKKKDFSSADRLLALNLNLSFFTPEEHFLKDPPGKYSLPLFNPSELNETVVASGDITSKNKEVVILVGYPGSGKSHFVTTHLVPAGYRHVNRDTLGTWQKCVLNMESALAAGRSVVIDNTNPDCDSRKRYLERAGDVPCRCFVFNLTLDHVRHNIRFRELTDPNHVPVNEMIVHSYKNKYEAPSLAEGFTEIVNINFVPSFSNPEHEKLYRMYLLEK